LSPKILDRAHIIRLDSPSLSDWKEVEIEIDKINMSNNIDYKINFKIEDFGLRKPYPQYTPNDQFCKEISKLSTEYLKKLGIEVSLRAIRQGLLYNELFSDFNSNPDIAFNNFVLHKIFPKFTFDGNVKIEGKKRLLVMESLLKDLKTIGGNYKILSVKDELNRIIQKSKENDDLVNYWA
jgi:hypothetical protein